MNFEICGVRAHRSDIANPNDRHFASGPEAALYLFHDHGFVLVAVYADNLQDAYEEAMESGELDNFALERWEVEESDDDYLAGLDYCNGEVYDLETVGVCWKRRPYM